MAVLAAVVLAGCGSGNSKPGLSPAATLYVLDHGKAPTALQVKPYELALRQAAHRCQDDEITVAHYTAGTVKQVADDTGKHRSALEVLVRFPKAWASSLDCTQKFTAYALLLEGSG